MVILVISGLLLLIVALLMREYQLKDERKSQAVLYEQLQDQLDSALDQQRQHQEDLYVLRTVLTDNGVLEEADLLRGHLRLYKEIHNQPSPEDEGDRESETPCIVVPDKNRTIH